MTTVLKSRKSLSDDLAGTIREWITTGKAVPDAYLPAERDLCGRFNVSRVTVRRSLGQLVKEGLLEAIPQKGYRPRALAASQQPVTRLAFIAGQVGSNEAWDPAHAGILGAFQRVLLPKATAVLAVGVKNREPAEVIRELLDARVNAVALDTSNPAMHEAAQNAGMPCVVVDAQCLRPDIDVVLQDNAGGARMAVEHLFAQGHRRIGWLGPTRGFVHWSERFAGAREGLWSAGLDFAPADILQPASNEAREEAIDLLRRRLAAPDAPTAWVCPWQRMTLAAAEVNQALSAKLALCGWAHESEYRDLLAPAFLGGMMPAVVTWRPEEMAELAWQRLELRARDPRSVACRINVKVRLIEPRSAEDVVRRGV